MDPDRANRHVNAGQNLELKFIDGVSSTSQGEMNRYLKTHSTVQPGNATTVTGIGSQTKRPFQSNLRSDSSLDQTLVSFRDVDAIKKIYHRRMRVLSGISFAFALLAAVLAIIDIEITRRRRARGPTASTETLAGDTGRLTGVVLKGILSLLSIMTAIVIHNIYMNARRINIIRNLYHESEGFLTSSLFPKYCIECVVCLIHVPPFVDELGVPYVYKLQLLVLLRLYLATRCLRERSELFHNQATNLLASVTKTDISSSFLVKTYFLKEPFKLIFTFYSMNVFLGGYCVYVIEESHSYLVSSLCLIVNIYGLHNVQ